MESRTKRIVMRRVRTVHAFRPFVSGTVLAAVLGLASLAAVGKLVFVSQVFRNMPAVEDVAAVARFFLSAFIHTEFFVQLCVLALIAAVFIMLRDIARLVRVGRTA